jgi:hypothetical protein
VFVELAVKVVVNVTGIGDDGVNEFSLIGVLGREFAGVFDVVFVEFDAGVFVII